MSHSPGLENMIDRLKIPFSLSSRTGVEGREPRVLFPYNSFVCKLKIQFNHDAFLLITNAMVTPACFPCASAKMSVWWRVRVEGR